MIGSVEVGIVIVQRNSTVRSSALSLTMSASPLKAGRLQVVKIGSGERRFARAVWPRDDPHPGGRGFEGRRNVRGDPTRGIRKQLIAEEAYRQWEASGRENGSDARYWLEAEASLQASGKISRCSPIRSDLHGSRR
jgi:hypothetical protein